MQKWIAPMFDGFSKYLWFLKFRISGSLRNRGRGRPASINKQNVGLSPSETNRDLLKRLFPDLEEQRVAHL